MSQEQGFAEHLIQPAVAIRRGPSTDEAGLSGKTTDEEQEVATQADAVSPGNQVEDIPASHSRSLWKSVGLVITCALAMMVNVSAYTTLQVDVCSCSPRLRQISSTTATSIALPTIGIDLHIPEARLQWITSAYSLSGVGSTAL
jgi:hypothetical protein